MALDSFGIQYSATVPSRLVTRRKAFARIARTGVSSVYGDDIIVVHGSQQLISVSNGAASTYILGVGNYTSSLSPDNISGTLGALGNRYNKYFFTSLQFEYVPYQPNSTDGHGFAFGYNAEGTPAEFTVGFSTVSTLENSMVLPMTGYVGGPEMNTLEVLPSRKTTPWFWNEADNATTAGQRQTTQGQFYGVADTAITNATTWGTIWLHYVIEFCDLTPDQGFTRTLRRALRDPLERDEIRRLLGEAGEAASLPPVGDATVYPVVGAGGSEERSRLSSDPVSREYHFVGSPEPPGSGGGLGRR